MEDPALIDPFTATKDGARLAAYDELVARAPAHPSGSPISSVDWLVTGYQAARAALTDPTIVKGRTGHSAYSDQLPPAVADAINHHLLAVNPPDHSRLRRLVSAAFTRRRCELLAPRIQQITDQLLGHLGTLAGGGPIDLLTEFAYPLPITVICELLGIPEADRQRFRGWTTPMMQGLLTEFEVYADAAGNLVGYLRDLLARKRREPADDLLSALIAVRDDGDQLTENELTSMVFLLLIAGHETTVNLIANAVRALLINPRQLATLRAVPELIEAAVEELLRFDGPLQSTIPAYTTTEVRLDGVTIPAHQVLVISLLAANRDPQRYPDAAQLDLFRPETSHLAFGHGIHHCLGAPLARLEARIALGSLLGRFPDLRLAVPEEKLDRLPGVLMNGLAELPVLLRTE